MSGKRGTGGGGGVHFGVRCVMGSAFAILCKAKAFVL